MILKQFVRKDGVLLPRIYTGLCAKQQRKVDMLVHKAQNAGKVQFYLKKVLNFQHSDQ